MHSVETYLKTLSEIHRTGGATAETSYYAALETLLNEVGVKLKPKVRAVSQLANTGAGQPDFGLFSANQFQRANDERPLEGVLPERGVVEVKGWSDDSFLTAEKEQVSKYWKKYGLVLVTNYRDFVLMGRDDHGMPVLLETYRMAESEKAFRALFARPRKAANKLGDRLLDFLRRVLLHEAALTDPEDLAWFLASYAREARYRVEATKDLPALAGLKKGLEEALGMTFEGEKGEHFFQATLVQTLFYGVFSSWVLWSRDHWEQPDAQFDWHNAAWTLHVPMVASLFNQIATPQKLRPLGVAEVLDWVGAALNRVDRHAFFSKFEEEHAVLYFYEPFLKAYDPELRKQLGVWYTPPEIVQYQVERVDRVLREELGIADGLADDNVVILDPCCGTGAYLVETLKRIHKTLEEKGGSALIAQKLKKAAIKRVFGFEILPAPFVISHLQLGLMLRNLGAPLDHDSDQRAGVYLTNALTGWEPLEDPKDLLLFPELKEEREAANKIKQEVPILVILGNPPYNGFAGTAMEEERDLVAAYRTTRRAPKPEGQGLNDLYVRFFRMAERRIVETSGKGVISYISNYSWLEGLSHPGMRERYLEAFDKIWIDCLNGDKYKTGKLTPWGESDPSVFSTETNREGIQVGTAISLLVLSEKGAAKDGMRCRPVRFRHLWGKDKHAEMQRNATGEEIAKYEKLTPRVELGYPLMPIQIDAGYLAWPQLPDLFPVYISGVQTKRDDFVVAFERKELLSRVEAYFDDQISDEEIASRFPRAMQATARFQPKVVRQLLVRRGILPQCLVQYMYRPFDPRWVYWEPETKLLGEKSPDFFPLLAVPGNLWIEARQKQPREAFDRGYVCSILADNFGNGFSSFFPLLLLSDRGPDNLFSEIEENKPRPNLSDYASAYLAKMKADHEALFYHTVTILHAPEFRTQNASALRQDWPRVPLPAEKEALLDSAALGRRVAALLDTETPVEGVTCGKIEPRLRNLGVIRRVDGGALDPDAGELDVSAGWGHAGARGVCMPGRGKVEEREGKSKKRNGLLGDTTLDIYLNDTAYWSNVPSVVWNYTLGGYQVIKKWLSYREKVMLGRGLKIEEAEYVTEMVRRIAALILLQSDLDNNYQTVKNGAWSWPEG